MSRQKRKKQGSGMQHPDSIGQRRDHGMQDRHGQDKVERKNPPPGLARRPRSENKRTKDKTEKRKQGQNTSRTQERAQRQKQGAQQQGTRERRNGLDWTRLGGRRRQCFTGDSSTGVQRSPGSQPSTLQTGIDGKTDGSDGRET